MAPTLFTINDLVEVDQMKSGYIINIDRGEQELLFTVRYCDGDVEDSVEKYRCRPKSLRRTTALRSGRVRDALPVAQSSDPPPITMETPALVAHPLHHPVAPPPAPQAPATIAYNDVKRAMRISQTWTAKALLKYPDVEHELYSILRRGKKESTKGWLRRLLPLEMQPAGEEKKTQLSAQAKILYLSMSTMMGGFESNGGVMGGWKAALNYAWDVDKRMMARVLNDMLDGDGCLERKDRSDKNVSVFECDEVRKKTFTALNVFKKRETRKFRTSHHRLDEKQLRQEFQNLPEEEKINYKIIADADLERARHLKEELVEVLQKTKGMVSYETLQAQLGDIVSKETIRKFVSKQTGFRMRKDRLLPHLDAQAKRNRVKWAQSFIVFWKSAMLIKSTQMMMVLVHQDEKWMFCVRCRSNNKVVPEWSVLPKDRYVHHKSHVGKEMYIVVTAFVLNANDITKGGIAVPIACIRVGRMVKAKKDSYRRVYREDGTYHYPQIETNILRRKGEEYFKGVELTGSSNGTEKDPKMSLLEQYQEVIMPALREKVVNKYNNGGTRKVCLYFQEDNAGYHNDKTYKAGKMELFDSEGHLIFNQPPQSPSANVHDFTIFPMMSKRISREQALTYGSRVMKGEQLNKAVIKVWKDMSALPAISRGFAGHHQVVCAMLAHDGDNNYLNESKGTSFNVRAHYVTNEAGDGVMLAEEEVNEGNLTEEFLARRTARRLKYDMPDARSLTSARLTPEMKDFLRANMDPDLLSNNEEMAEVWMRIDEEDAGSRIQGVD